MHSIEDGQCPALPRRRPIRDALQFLVEALDTTGEVLRRQVKRYGQAPQDADRGLLACRLDQGHVRTVDAGRASDVFLTQSKLISALFEGGAERLQEDWICAGSHASHYLEKVH